MTGTSAPGPRDVTKESPTPAASMTLYRASYCESSSNSCCTSGLATTSSACGCVQFPAFVTSSLKSSRPCSFQPISGGKQMINDRIHTQMISRRARLGDMSVGYLTGRLMATYRSILIAHRLKMEAVQSHTSTASHIRHQTAPNDQ